MKTLLHLAFALLFAGALSAADVAPSEVSFESFSDICVARIGGDRHGAEFHGYRIDGKWKRLAGGSGKKIGALLRNRVTKEVAARASDDDIIVLSPFCFNPGLAVRLETNRGVRDFLVCMECSFLYVFDEAEARCGMNIESRLSRALRAEYRRIFGNSAFSNRPNQALQPTRVLVTCRADARPAPSTRVADL